MLFLRSGLVALALAAPLPAQFTGTWTLASCPDLPALIDKATAPMQPAQRTHARGMLMKNNVVPRKITIQHAAGKFILTCDDRRPLRMPDNALGVPWVDGEGQKFLVSARVEGSDLVQVLMGEDGMRTCVFHADRGTLTVRVTVKAMLLPG
ncbi:MAG TPA: hypothetical protein VN436_02080, partial [Holophaga sp.]|nr:hypothetical protein [Holophaga sp.]